MIMKARKVDIVTPVETCEGGCGRKVAVTRRQDDGATQLATIGADGAVWPGGHNAIFHRRDGRDPR
jgi:hypothetical protein